MSYLLVPLFEQMIEYSHWNCLFQFNKVHVVCIIQTTYLFWNYTCRWRCYSNEWNSIHLKWVFAGWRYWKTSIDQGVPHHVNVYKAPSGVIFVNYSKEYTEMIGKWIFKNNICFLRIIQHHLFQFICLLLYKEMKKLNLMHILTTRWQTEFKTLSCFHLISLKWGVTKDAKNISAANFQVRVIWRWNFKLKDWFKDDLFLV